MPAPQNHPHSSSGIRIPFLVAGVVSGVIALGLLLSSAGLLWADSEKDSRGYFSTDRETFRADTPALVTENLDVDVASADWLVDASDLGDVRLSVTPESSKPVFVGVGPTADVQRYLDRTAHTTVTDIDYEPFDAFGGLDANLRDTDGAARAGQPAAETFWAESASGHGTQELRWKLRDGNWSAVVMNADGSAGVDVGIEAGSKVSVLDELGWTALGGGAIFALLTAGLIRTAVRPRTRHA